MKKNIFTTFLCVLFIVSASFTYANANNSNANSDKDDLTKVNNYAQENLSQIKEKLNSETTVTSPSSSKSKKKAYELFGFNDSDEVTGLEVGKIFKVYTLYDDNLNEDDDLKNLVSPSNTYEVFLNSNKKPKIRVTLSWNKTNNKFQVLEYGEIEKQMAKGLNKTDENAIMFTTNLSDRYLTKSNAKDKVLPAISCESDPDELPIKDFVKRYNEQRETGKKMFEKYKSKTANIDK